MKTITIGITAHVDAGKTTLSEAILYLTGAIRQPGRVDHGSAFLDDDPIERERGITIFSQQARFALGDIEATLIDTPGHVDFSAEMERSLWVLDYGLLVVSGSEGIQPHTKTIYRMLKERGIPCFVFVNKMDIAVKSKEELISKFEAELDMPAVDFSGAAKRTDEFIDAVTLHSVSLAEAVLEGMQDDDGGEDEIISDRQIAQAVASGEIVPVMFGSALKMEGVEELLEVIRRYTEQAAYGSGFGAKVYRTQAAKDGEKLCFIKVTGGELRVRDTVRIKSAGEEDAREAKVNQIRLYSGSKYETADSAEAGSVCAVTGLGLVLPGSALGEEEPSAELSSSPFMIYSVEAPEGMDVHDLMDDMRVLTAEDPALNASWSEDGSEVLIRIMGQVQLEVLQREILERFGYEVEFGRGRVLYMETISDTYEGVGHFEPLRHYAEVHLIIEPGERGRGIALVEGGKVGNVICKKTEAKAAVNKAEIDQIRDEIAAFEEVLRHEFQATDPEMKITVSEADGQGVKIMDKESSARIITWLMTAPNGIQHMSAAAEGEVETSLNLGAVNTEDGVVKFIYAIRSSSASRKHMLMDRLELLAKVLGGSVSFDGDYPGWEYLADSALRETAIGVFKEQYGHDPEVLGIHAGLECGLIAEKIGEGFDAISIEPDLDNLK